MGFIVKHEVDGEEILLRVGFNQLDRNRPDLLLPFLALYVEFKVVAVCPVRELDQFVVGTRDGPRELALGACQRRLRIFQVLAGAGNISGKAAHLGIGFLLRFV